MNTKPAAILLIVVGLTAFFFLDSSRPSLAQENNTVPDWLVYPGAVLLTENSYYQVCLREVQLSSDIRHDCDVIKRELSGKFLGVIETGEALLATYVIYDGTEEPKILDWYREKFSSLGLVESNAYQRTGPESDYKYLVFYCKGTKCASSSVRTYRVKRFAGKSDLVVIDTQIDFFINKLLLTTSQVSLDIKFTADPIDIYERKGRDKELNPENEVVGAFDPRICTAEISGITDENQDEAQILFSGNTTLFGQNKPFSETLDLKSASNGQFVKVRNAPNGNLYLLVPSEFWGSDASTDITCSFTLKLKEQEITKSAKLHIPRYTIIYLPIWFSGDKTKFKEKANSEHQEFLKVAGLPAQEAKAILRFERQCQTDVDLGDDSSNNKLPRDMGRGKILNAIHYCVRYLNESYSPETGSLVGLHSVTSESPRWGSGWTDGFAWIGGGVAFCSPETEPLVCPHELGHSLGGLCDEYNYDDWSRQNKSGCPNPYPTCANDNPGRPGGNNCFDIPNCFLFEQDGVKVYTDTPPPLPGSGKNVSAGANFSDKKSVMGVLTNPKSWQCENQPFTPIYPVELPKL